MDLQTLIDEFAREGIGEHLYTDLRRVVRAVALGRGYPPTYSPTGRWDEDALSGLAHDWITDKLLRYGQLKHLLLANQTLGGLRRGLELSFQDFLISRRKRTALDNLFQRANTILEEDPRFACVIQATKKAARYWGLAAWEDRPLFQGPDDELIAAGLRQQDIAVIHYRAEARKATPVVSGPELARFLHGLIEDVGHPLSLAQITTALKYRFDLLEVEEISLDTPIGEDGDGSERTLATVLSDERSVEEGVLNEDLARAILREMPGRQKLALLASNRPGATLTSIAEALGCSKSTVDNELRRAMQIIRRHTDSAEEARTIYRRILLLLGEA